MKWEYHGNSSISFVVIIAGRKIPIEIRNFQFLGTVCINFIKHIIIIYINLL